MKRSSGCCPDSVPMEANGNLTPTPLCRHCRSWDRKETWVQPLGQRSHRDNGVGHWIFRGTWGTLSLGEPSGNWCRRGLLGLLGTVFYSGKTRGSKGTYQGYFRQFSHQRWLSQDSASRRRLVSSPGVVVVSVADDPGTVKEQNEFGDGTLVLQTTH